MLLPVLLIHLLFFFQAEDGIRDGHVTGVQTCALPISDVAIVRPPRTVATSAPRAAAQPALPGARSEERRVGKECGAGGGGGGVRRQRYAEWEGPRGRRREARCRHRRGQVRTR